MMFWGWMLIAPTLIGLLILNIIPVIQTLIMSFQNVSTFGESTWVFLDNYKRLFEDPKFWLSLKNTLLYGIIQVPRSEEHTSELQSRFELVCRLLLEKKKEYIKTFYHDQ